MRYSSLIHFHSLIFIKIFKRFKISKIKFRYIIISSFTLIKILLMLGKKNNFTKLRISLHESAQGPDFRILLMLVSAQVQFSSW